MRYSKSPYSNSPLAVLVLVAGAGAVTPAHAHAFLEHAVPGVGATVGGAPGDLELSFTQNVVVALSGVSVAGDSGAVAVAKPVAASPDTLRVHLARPLQPGTYTVTWHVVSVDTHPTSGSFKFTVAP